MEIMCDKCLNNKAKKGEYNCVTNPNMGDCYEGNNWVLYTPAKPNVEELKKMIVLYLEQFVGTPKVRCDEELNPPEKIKQGIVTCEITMPVHWVGRIVQEEDK